MKVKRVGGIFVAGLLVVGLAACAKAPPKVKVEKLQLELDAQQLELAVGESYTVTPVAVADGTTLAEPAIEWSSSDPNVATVVDGVITAQESGNTTVTVNCQYGGMDACDTVKVTVKKPVVEMDLETPVIIDLSTEDGGLIAFELPVDVSNVDNVMVGETEFRIVSQGDQALINVTFMTPGEYIMTVEQEKQIVSFPVYVATTVIRSAEELHKATRMAAADKGYFVLGANIDCSELSDPICFTDKAVFETNLGQNRAGFLGGFNGMGYTISNLTVPENGLFGCLAGSGVIRNVAFTNLQAEKYALCIYSAGLISQVYVQGDFSRVLMSSFGPANQLKNIVAESTQLDALLCQHIASVDTTGYSVSEVYGLIMVGQGAQISKYSRTKQFNGLVSDDSLRVFSGATKESIPAVTAEDGFNGYWDISSGYPIFISSVQ